MMKLPEYCLTGILAAVLAAGCSTIGGKNAAEKEKNQISAITELDLQSAVSAGRKMGDDLLESFKSKDFALASGIPIGDEKKRLTREKFDARVKSLEKAGGIAGYTYLGDLAYGAYRRLLWKVEFKGVENTPAADMLFEVLVVRINGQYRLAGFGFRP